MARWVFTPHLLVAFLSLPYWDTNPWLVGFAWWQALVGTAAESKTGLNRRHHYSHGR